MPLQNQSTYLKRAFLPTYLRTSEPPNLRTSEPVQANLLITWTTPSTSSGHTLVPWLMPRGRLSLAEGSPIAEASPPLALGHPKQMTPGPEPGPGPESGPGPEPGPDPGPGPEPGTGPGSTTCTNRTRATMAMVRGCTRGSHSVAGFACRSTWCTMYHS